MQAGSIARGLAIASRKPSSDSANEDRQSDVVITGYGKCAATVSSAVHVDIGDKEAPPERTCEQCEPIEVGDGRDRKFTIERLTPKDTLRRPSCSREPSRRIVAYREGVSNAN